MRLFKKDLRTGPLAFYAGRVCSQIQLVHWVSALHHQHHSPLVAANAPCMQCTLASTSKYFSAHVTSYVSRAYRTYEMFLTQ